jgi:GNAT superfamily N-acetyltransferase
MVSAKWAWAHILFIGRKQHTMAIEVCRAGPNDQRLLAALGQLNRLLQELSERAVPLSRGALKQILAQPSLHYFAAWQGQRLLGVTLLYIKRQQLDVKADIEEVVVTAGARGPALSVAPALMSAAEAAARREGANRIWLTSGEKRVAANRFYQSRGYQHYHTNVYYLPL